MKNVLAVLCAMVFIFSISGCKTPSRTGSSGGVQNSEVQGEMVYYKFSAVHSPRPGQKPSDVIMWVTIGYFDNPALAAEIAAKDEVLQGVISEFAKTIESGHLSDFSRYNQAHDTLKELMNKKLDKGTVQKILFRKIETLD